MMWNLHRYPTTVLNEKMWHFREPKHTLTPPTYFQRVHTSNFQGLRPRLYDKRTNSSEFIGLLLMVADHESAMPRLDLRPCEAGGPKQVLDVNTR